VRKGARGLERRVAHIEPIVVNVVNRRVASAGWKSAPARTFCNSYSYQSIVIREEEKRNLPI
jgi:hypothetical protein